MNNRVRALIVDDDQLSVVVLSRLIEAQGGSPIVLFDPRLIHETLDEVEMVELVFLDLEMPGLDGYEVLAMLRERLGAAVPVVAYTVHVSEANAALQRGFDGFLGKPINGRAFPEHWRRILSGERVWVTQG